ncbi:MAG: Fic family protein [Gemmatimonadaceae bacterium]|nr:Fic family protein [Gemmatimonadaceae bacterium]
MPNGLDYLSFVPSPLPPQLTYDAELVALMSDADAAVGELAGVGSQLPNPHVLLAPYVRREAVLSSRIEGTEASLSDVYEDEAMNGQPTSQSPDVQEVRNYIAALEYGIAQVRGGRRIDNALLLELHARLMGGVRGADKHPGEFRVTQNWIGFRGSTPATAIFVPPHPEVLPHALGAWENFVPEHSRSVPPLVACALLHQQFETLHPFLDGNGRIGRLLIPLYLLERQRLPLPLLYLSAYIDEYKSEYARLLQRVRTEGDWEAWLQFFLRGVAETAKEGAIRARDILDAYERARDAVADNAHSVRLLRALLQNPFTSTAKTATELGVSLPTARKALDALKAAGLLQDAAKRGRTPLFVAHTFLELFTRRG